MVLGAGGFKLLVAPVGNRIFEGVVLARRVEGVRNLVQALPSLEYPHIEISLLCSCLAFPKLAFSLRTTDTSTHLEVKRSFDAIVSGGLEEVLGSPLSDALSAKL